MSPGECASSSQRLSAENLRGKTIRLSGQIRGQGLSDGFAGLWIRVDGPKGAIVFENMGDNGVTGTRPWELHSVSVPVADDAVAVYCGALLAGNGTAWFDSLDLEVVQSAGVPSAGQAIR